VIGIHDGQSPVEQPTPEPLETEKADLTAAVNAEQETPIPPAGTMRAGEAGSIDDHDDRTWVLEAGSDVIGSCGHKVGEIVDVEPNYIVVEVGFFHPSDLYVPKTAIGDHHDADVVLNLTKQQAMHQGWEEEPAS